MEDTDYKEVVKEILKKGKFTPGELARKLGVDVRSVTRWVAGERLPKTLAIKRQLDRLLRKVNKKEAN